MFAKYDLLQDRHSRQEYSIVNPDHQITSKRLLAALHRSLELAKPEVPGLAWLIPLAEGYLDPTGIHVVWVFNTRASLTNALEAGSGRLLYQLTATALREAHMQVDDIAVNVHFDTEEDCQHENQGNWQSRLSIRYYPAREMDEVQAGQGGDISSKLPSAS
ncbi:hypothetical protein [Halopseudomonas salina]|uniref:DUF3168 domain-containing protein n=1 Tax=Halopseudomonas salina TaxID=1323744 RepID=A0ABQ1PCK9_9GAMM|nr:hypothetical protein [Halopseudomonas salina]GGC94593.1 hypothetical protein GCM10007418_12710 [Halopseudomonas salina]